jgi:hypothetical protein
VGLQFQLVRLSVGNLRKLVSTEARLPTTAIYCEKTIDVDNIFVKKKDANPPS